MKRITSLLRAGGLLFVAAPAWAQPVQAPSSAEFPAQAPQSATPKSTAATSQSLAPPEGETAPGAPAPTEPAAPGTPPPDAPVAPEDGTSQQPDLALEATQPAQEEQPEEQPTTQPQAAPASQPQVLTADEPDEQGPAQRQPLGKNAIFIEMLGPAMYYSVNYERQVGGDVGLRVGAGYVTFSQNGANGTSLLAVPIAISYSGVRSGQNAFELHGGATIVAASSGTGFVGGTVQSDMVFPMFHAGLGYRRHPLEGKPGFFLRAGLDVTAIVADFRAVFPWPYVGVGAVF